MNYTKLDMQPIWTATNEIVVRLDSGELVSVILNNEVSHKGGFVAKAVAVVMADAETPLVALDANGEPLHSTASLHVSHECAREAMKEALQLVLGEYQGERFEGPSKEQQLADFSIRTNIASAKHAGKQALHDLL